MGYVETLCIKKKGGIRTMFCTTQVIKLNNLSSITVETDFYRGVDKSLARAGRKQATATEDFEFHIPYL
jgi:hypothetical protein